MTRVRAFKLEPGEPAAGPWRTVEVTALVEQLHAGAGSRSGRPQIVVIDGRGGSGKSTLAQRLRAVAPNSAVVHTDDVAWHHSFFDWAGLLADNVLQPLRRGEAVSYRPAAWTERGRPGSITLPAGLRTVWVEGTGVLRRELRPFFDASVWVQVDRVEAAQRLRDRDGDTPAQRQLIADWGREEGPFLLQQQPWRHATLIAAGSAVLDDPSATYLVIAPPVSAIL